MQNKPYILSHYDFEELKSYIEPLMKMCCFYPDFIFWLRHRQSKEYKIVFIDPKGLTHEVNARDKAQGFESIFGESKGLENQVFLYCFNPQSTANLSQELQNYAKSTLAEIFCL